MISIIATRSHLFLLRLLLISKHRPNFLLDKVISLTFLLEIYKEKFSVILGSTGTVSDSHTI